jgi:hypothetical protein
MVGSPGAHFDFADTYYSRSTYKFLTLVYEDQKLLRENPLDTSFELTPNPVAIPDWKAIRSNEFVI